jgi:hypothetical protein
LKQLESSGGGWAWGFRLVLVAGNVSARDHQVSPATLCKFDQRRSQPAGSGSHHHLVLCADYSSGAEEGLGASLGARSGVSGATARSPGICSPRCQNSVSADPQQVAFLCTSAVRLGASLQVPQPGECRCDCAIAGYLTASLCKFDQCQPPSKLRSGRTTHFVVRAA